MSDIYENYIYYHVLHTQLFDLGRLVSNVVALKTEIKCNKKKIKNKKQSQLNK